MLSEYEPEIETHLGWRLWTHHTINGFLPTVLSSSHLLETRNIIIQKRKKKGGDEVPNPSKLSDLSHRIESWIALYIAEGEKKSDVSRSLDSIVMRTYWNHTDAVITLKALKSTIYIYIYIYKGFLFKMVIWKFNFKGKKDLLF